MKKLISLLLAAVMLVIVFSACSDKTDAAPEGEKPALSVVATVFPQYDWTREILGDNPAGAKLTLLLDDGVDLHICQPTVEDMAKIVECDVFIYVGGESDEWVADALNEADTSYMTVINLMDALGLSHIMVIESSDKRIAETIRDNTASKDQTILTLDSMQSAGARETENGATYIGIMEDNLNILKEALT